MRRDWGDIGDDDRANWEERAREWNLEVGAVGIGLAQGEAYDEILTRLDGESRPEYLARLEHMLDLKSNSKVPDGS